MLMLRLVGCTSSANQQNAYFNDPGYAVGQPQEGGNVKSKVIDWMKGVRTVMRSELFS